jgi:hypothetical protein
MTLIYQCTPPPLIREIGINGLGLLDLENKTVIDVV